MPDRLASLSARIPDLMKELAQCKVEEPDFKFVAWRPRMRSRTVLIPAPETAEEDAMEAILEVMETEIPENSVVEVESISELENEESVEEPEEETIEEEAPKKKVGGVKGLVSGGGRDGVGKFGALGDVIGGITDRIGVTDYGLAGKKCCQEKGTGRKSIR